MQQQWLGRVGCASSAVGRAPARSRRVLALATATFVFAAQSGRTAVAATPADWSTATSGNWTDPTRWSTAPNFPNNGTPAGATYAAHVGAAGSAYTVTANGAITVDSLLIDAAPATVSVTGGTFTATQGLTVNGGTFLLDGGTLANTTIGGTGGQVTFKSGELDGVTLARDALVNVSPIPAQFAVRNGLTLNGGATLTLSVTGGGNTVRFQGTQTLGGNGTLVLGGGWTVQSGTLTIGAGVTVGGGSEIGFASATVLNLGTIRATANWLNFNPSGSNKLVNQGLVEAATNGRIDLACAFDNSAGIIRANGGTIFLGATSTSAPSFTTAQLGTIEAVNGGVFKLIGPVVNTGATLTASDTTGKLEVSGGTITGGTLATSGSAEFFSVNAGTTLNNVTVAGQLSLRPASFGSGANVQTSQLALNGGTISLFGIAGGAGANAQLNTEGANDSITGTGQILFDGGTDNNQVRGQGGTLTIGSGVTIRTATGGGEIYGAGLVTNAGTISAQTAGRTITLTNVRNTGTLQVINGSTMAAESLDNRGPLTVNGSTLSLTGTWTNGSGTMSVSNASTVTFGGTLTAIGSATVANSSLNLAGAITGAQLNAIAFTNTAVRVVTNGVISNAGSTLTVGNGYTLTMAGGRINGGTIAAAGAGDQLTVETSNIGHLDAVTLALPLSIPDRTAIRVYNGLALQNANITITATDPSTSPGIDFMTTGTISGTGEIVFNGTSELGAVQPGNNGVTATIGSGVTVRTGTTGGRVGTSGLPLANDGLISARTTGRTLTVTGTTVANRATIEVRDGSILNLTNVTNTGQINASNAGQLTLAGNWTNAGGTINVTNAPVALTGTSTGLGTITQSGVSASVTFNATLTNTSSTADIGTVGTLRIGTNAIINGGSVINTGGTGQFLGTGSTSKLTLNGVSLNAPVNLPSGGTLTFGGAWTNLAVVTLNNATLNLGGTFTPAAVGTINRTGGQVNITGTLDNSGGTLLLDNAKGTWNLAAGGTIVGGTVQTSGTGALAVTGGTSSSAKVDGVTLDTNLTLTGQRLNVTNGLTLPARKISGSGARVVFSGTAPQTLDGAGELAFDTNSSNTILNSALAASSAVVTFGDGTLVHGGFLTVDGGAVGIINRGTISADPGGTLILRNVTNQGNGMVVVNGGLLRIDSNYSSATPLALQNATLGGTGTVNTSVNNNGSTIAPGNSIGTLTIVGDVTFINSAQLEAELGASSADLLKVTGDLDLSGSNDRLTLVPIGTLSAGATYTVTTYTGNLTGTFDQVTPGYTVSYDTPNAIMVTFVPEPGSVGLAAAGLLLALRRRRVR
jgi:hypothetical protein